MTTHHLTLAAFTKPLSGSFSSISRAALRYLEHRAEKARLANDLKLLLAMDSHMLNDIGLPDNSRLVRAQQERLLRDIIWHASKI